MVNPIKRFVGSSRIKQGGFLACAKQDLNAHVTGGDWRHTANNIDLDPILPGFSGTTVQQTFNQMLSYMTGRGYGFVSIGDTLGNVGEYNVNSVATPTLQATFNAAFADARLTNGGTILMLPGRYKTSLTITIPSGITIMGDLAGTTIIGETPELPMFRVTRTGLTTTIGGDSGGGEISLDPGAPEDVVTLFNLNIADNLDGVIQAGGVIISSMRTVPMVLCETGSHLTCENVRFLGKIDNGPVAGRGKTLQAIGYTIVGGTGTHLTLRRCFFDGMRTAVQFDPANGTLDHLVVDKCRARTIGTENFVLPNVENNCFVSFTQCHATLTNNEHFGLVSAAPTVNACFVILNSAAATVDETHVVVVGNHGVPATGLDTGSILMSQTPALITQKATISGNHWASNVDSAWCVVVGELTTATNRMGGDFIGAGAIDVLLDVDFCYPTTVIVNPGTYDVTVGGGLAGKNYNFIGNKIDNEYPVFALDVAGAGITTDLLGNEFIDVGSSIKSIHFVTNPGSIQYHSVHLNANDKDQVEAIDCIFENCVLYVPELAPAAGVKTKVLVENCQFHQDSSYADNIGALLPSADTVTVKDCIFTGGGYACGVGQAAGIGYTHTVSDVTNISFINCIMDLTGETITAASPVTGQNSYLWVLENTARVTFENCQILANNTLTTVATNIAAGLLVAPATVVDFINILGRDITFENCLLNGPEQTYFAAVNTAIPTLLARPTQSFRFNNSKIFGGGLPLQIRPPLADALFTQTKWGGIEITHSEFATSTTGAVPQTLLDVDIDLAAYDLSTDLDPQVIVSHNVFTNRVGAGGGAYVNHTNFTGGKYDVQGVVQIFAPGHVINVNNNKMLATIRSTAIYAHYAGLAVNNADASSAQNINALRRTKIHDNIFDIISFAAGGAGRYNATIWCQTGIAEIHDNVINMYNQAALIGTFIGCLYIYATESALVSAFADAIICDNMFSRRDPSTGALASLQAAYIYIDAASARGQILDNAFDSPTIDGATLTLVSDNTTQPNKWLYTRNKNQTETFAIKPYDGQIIDGYAPEGPGGTWTPVMFGAASFLDIRSDSDACSGLVVVAPAFSREMFFWFIDLYGLLPDGVRIISATVTGVSDITLAVGEISVILRGNTPTELEDTMDFSTGTGGIGPWVITHTPTNVSAATTFENDPTENLHILIRPSNDPVVGGLETGGVGVPATIDFTDIMVVYRW